MSELYTRDDVIIWPDDPRLKDLKTGDLVFAGDNYAWLLEDANANHRPYEFICVDMECDNTFTCRSSDGLYAFTFIIIKRETKKKWVPFDLSDEKVRDFLRGKWIRHKIWKHEHCITVFTSPEHFTKCWLADGIHPEELFEEWEFIDGSPCGMEAEE